MSGFIPGRKPDIKRDEIEALIKREKVPKKYSCVLVALRGFYEKMGDPYGNDRRIYDDAFAFITPGTFATFNGNTDPNGYRYGYGTGAKKGMASLKLGTWYYRKGIHKTYPAFIQADRVTVIRDGKNGDYEDTGWFGINIHRGGSTSTSSLGCLTVPREQWLTFKQLIYSELSRFNESIFPLLLVDAPTQFKTDTGESRKPVLRLGDRGQAVRALQTVLQVMTLSVASTLVVDGDFGPITESHVKAFQKIKGLVDDGIVGPKTWAKIDDFVEENAKRFEDPFKPIDLT